MVFADFGKKTIVVTAGILALIILTGGAYGVVVKRYLAVFSNETAIPDWMMVNNGHIGQSEADQSNALLVRTPYNEEFTERGGLETRNGTFVGLPTTGDSMSPLQRSWAWWNISITTNPHQIANGEEPAYNVSVFFILYDHRYAVAHSDPNEHVNAYGDNFTAIYIFYDKDLKQIMGMVHGKNTTEWFSQVLFSGIPMNSDTLKIYANIKFDGRDSNNTVSLQIGVIDSTNSQNVAFGSRTYRTDFTFDLNNAMLMTTVVYSSGERDNYVQYEGEYAVDMYSFTYGDFTSGGTGGNGGSSGSGEGGGTGNNTGDNNETNSNATPVSLFGENWMVVAIVVAIVVGIAVVSYVVFFRRTA